MICSATSFSINYSNVAYAEALRDPETDKLSLYCDHVYVTHIGDDSGSESGMLSLTSLRGVLDPPFRQDTNVLPGIHRRLQYRKPALCTC